uniref:RNA-directed DNA polymerase, eukaryota, reverse transcriptase zinc-binding domain protein n=1 Tax=Tanacetum cinerariifolium TaxID=118510 RepID=A0A699Q987_TANCI|nr:RNA-directed DNA polymerase, eukaryota, reverse transcriptase zinc-binding domain protein [Tanacetum cinerariifolium]
MRFGEPLLQNFMEGMGVSLIQLTCLVAMGSGLILSKLKKNIEGIDLNFSKSFVRKVAGGANTSFWHDPWCGDGTSLKNKFPRLYALESFKDCKVKDIGLVINEAWVGSWAWRIPPRGRARDK